MNKIRIYLMLLLVTCLTVGLQSCDIDDDENARVSYPSALVTLKINPKDSTFYMQLDSATTLIPTNMNTSPSGTKQVRALVNYKVEDDATKKEMQRVYVNWIDTIRTKPLAVNLGAKNGSVYGSYPLEILKDWTTIVEDGYFTMRFRTYYGGQAQHTISLVQTDEPYVLELHQNPNGDKEGGVMRDGLIAFDLSSLPDTQGKTVQMTIKWKSFSGDKSTTFKYCTVK